MRKAMQNHVTNMWLSRVTENSTKHMTDPYAFNNWTEISRPSRLSYPAFALPGSRAPGSRPFRSDLRQCHPAARKRSESRCYPAASHATRQSRVSIVCHPAVRRPSNSGPDCGLSKHYPAFVAWKSPRARPPLRPSAWSGARRWGESCGNSRSRKSRRR